ncbi:unnamed protein product [Amoebophrya sp. A25]|nr:unnamed protein product [Amoebophrya sp. A25]|eukprot:GSA25T00019024001.1
MSPVDFEFVTVGKFGNLLQLLNLEDTRSSAAAVLGTQRPGGDSGGGRDFPGGGLPVSAVLYALTCRAYRPVAQVTRGPPWLMRLLLLGYMSMFFCGCCVRKLQYGVWFGDSGMEILMGVGRYLVISTHTWLITLYACYPVLEMYRRLRLAEMLLAVFGDARALANLEQKYKKVDVNIGVGGGAGSRIRQEGEQGGPASRGQGTTSDAGTTSTGTSGTTVSGLSKTSATSDGRSTIDDVKIEPRRRSKIKQVVSEVNASADKADGEMIIGSQVVERHLSLTASQTPGVVVSTTALRAVGRFKKGQSRAKAIETGEGTTRVGLSGEAQSEAQSEAPGGENRTLSSTAEPASKVMNHHQSRETDYTVKVDARTEELHKDEEIRGRHIAQSSKPPPPTPLPPLSDYEFVALHQIGLSTVSDLVAFHAVLRVAGSGTFFLNFGTRYSSAFAVNYEEEEVVSFTYIY